MFEDVRRFVMDVKEKTDRQLAAQCTSHELTGVMGAIGSDREVRFNHYLLLIRGK